ncbi:TrkH family potassium uptake protein [Mycoplasmopsis iners]|uniref:TrkH family potassium uptake protein n=1 Tax=Mycoplasmopsis iners TaxID=76630 RepID=UPI0004956ED3|nr:potassium transporter TrkG [Mycoplasmopsis iners]
MNKWKFSYWWRNNSFAKFWNKLTHWRKRTNKVRLIFFTYLLIIVISAILLLSPATHNNTQNGWKEVSVIDAFFISASAFSDTGLVTRSTYDTWNIFGQTIIAILIFVGGVGIFALKIYLINFFFFRNHRISLNQINLASTERTAVNGREAKKIITDSVSSLLIIFLVSALGLSFYFYFAAPRQIGEITASLDPKTNLMINQSAQYAEIGKFISPHQNWGLSFRYGFFHSLSALNNAGFDIIGQNSLFAYYHNVELQVFFLILFLIGGLGYTVIHDILNYFRFKIHNKGRKYHWQLLTKISISTYLIVTLIGFLTIIIFQTMSNGTFWTNDASFYGSKAKKIWAILFTTFSSRSAGFATLPIKNLGAPSIFLISILMFIGAGPASTGGGIRTTSFAILLITLFSRLLGRPSVRVFKRRIGDTTVRNSFTVFLTSLILVILVALIISTSSQNISGNAPIDQINFNNYIFEASSAFGTAGLTAGVTDHLNNPGKIAMTILMFIGQLGVSSSILVWGKKRNYSYKYEYLTEDVVIG